MCLHSQPHNFNLLHFHCFKSIFFGHIYYGLLEVLTIIDEKYQIYVKEI